MYVFTGPGVSRGEPYIPDEVAKSIIDKKKLNKGDTISKQEILDFLKENDLPVEMVTDVAIKIRNVFGVQPTFNESVSMNKNLITELTAVLEDRDPAEVIVESAEPIDYNYTLTESDVNRIIEAVIQKVFNEAEDELDEVIATSLSMMPWEEVEELAWLDRILEDNEKNQFELCMESGSDQVVNAWITAVTRPHMSRFLDESVSHELSEALGGQTVKLLECLANPSIVESGPETAGLRRILRLNARPDKTEVPTIRTKNSDVNAGRVFSTAKTHVKDEGPAPKLVNDPAEDDVEEAGDSNTAWSNTEVSNPKNSAKHGKRPNAPFTPNSPKRGTGQVQPIPRIGNLTLDKAGQMLAMNAAAKAGRPSDRIRSTSAGDVIKTNLSPRRSLQPNERRISPDRAAAASDSQKRNAAKDAAANTPSLASRVKGALGRAWGRVKDAGTVAKNTFVAARDMHKAGKEVAAQKAAANTPAPTPAPTPAAPEPAAAPTAPAPVREPGQFGQTDSQPTSAPPKAPAPPVGNKNTAGTATKKPGILGRILGMASSAIGHATNIGAAAVKGAWAGGKHAVTGGQVGVGQVVGAAGDLGKSLLRAPGEEASAFLARREAAKKAEEAAKKKAAKDAAQPKA